MSEQGARARAEQLWMRLKQQAAELSVRSIHYISEQPMIDILAEALTVKVPEQDARARAIAEQLWKRLMHEASTLSWHSISFTDEQPMIDILAEALSATADTARAQGRQDGELMVGRVIAAYDSQSDDNDLALSEVIDDAREWLRARVTPGDTP